MLPCICPFQAVRRPRDWAKFPRFFCDLEGPAMSELRLAHGLRFEDLYDPAGLARIDGLFVDHLRASDEGLAGRLMAARAEPASLDAKAESALIIAAAAHVDDFLGELFGIRDELAVL